MSVVNQMLKDLEDRQADENGVSAVYQPPSPEKSSRSSHLLMGLLVLLVVIIIAGAALWWFQSSKQQTAANTNDATVTATEPTQPKPMIVRASVDEEAGRQIDEESADPAPQAQQVTTSTAAENKTIVDVEQPQTANEANTLDNQQGPINDTPQLVQTSPVIVEVATVEEKPSPVFSKQSSTERESTLSLREQAQLAVRAGQDQQAILLLEQLLQNEPDNIAVRKKLAALLFSQGNLVKSRQILEQGIVIQPDDASLRLMLARLMEQQSAIDEALAIMFPATNLQGINAEFLGYRAGLADAAQSYSIAFDDYRALTQLQPGEARWWLGLGIAGERTQQPQQALSAYRRAIELRQLSVDVQRFIQQRITVLVGTQ